MDGRLATVMGEISSVGGADSCGSLDVVVVVGDDRVEGGCAGVEGVCAGVVGVCGRVEAGGGGELVILVGNGRIGTFPGWISSGTTKKYITSFYIFLMK